MSDYDSTQDTLDHIMRVKHLLERINAKLMARAEDHDKTKLESPEKEVFDEFTPKLKGSTFGSDEYKGFLKAMKPALDHHYAFNRHHPEHFGLFGIEGMNLIDLLEMLADWKAASERHDDGDILKSLEINRKRFNFPPPLKKILFNTIVYLGWVKNQSIAEPVREEPND